MPHLKLFPRSVLLLATLLACVQAFAGGSGLNTVVVVNQASSNSIELGNYFCEKRQVPPDNVLRISWSGGNILWSSDQFQTNLLTPLLNMLAARQLTNQIDYVVLSMDIPFQTANGTVLNGTTSVLFYGLKTDSGLPSLGMTNSYFKSEQVFRDARPASATGYSFLTTMLTSTSLAQAKAIVDNGVVSDATFPSQPVVLAKSSDVLRNIRYHNFDNAVFNTRLAGRYSVVRTNCDSPLGLSNLFGFQTGLYQFSISPNTFVPGAMADSMTSFGGSIFGPNDQTTLLAFINAGASGSYGTVTEPGAVAEKFPSPLNYFYQARGFNIAECYYQSLSIPYEGLIVGEPLAAPCQILASGAWLGAQSNATLFGTASLAPQFTGSTDHPLQQIDLFIDGKFSSTLTNIAPQPGNVLSLTVKNNPMTYTVPQGATLTSIASNLARIINLPVNTNITRTLAYAFGDRIELHATSTNRLAAPNNIRAPSASQPTNPPGQIVAFLATNSAGSGSTLTTFLSSSRPVFLNSQAFGINTCSVNGIINPGYWLKLSVTKTNGSVVTVSATNQSSTATPADLAFQLATNINNAPLLQGPDGVIAEDPMLGSFGAGTFNLRTRSPGYLAAGLVMNLTGSSQFVISPAGPTLMYAGLSDLQPRNHLYVRAGAPNLGSSFLLDTRTLSDGYHELTAVAYEGTSVRTQTRITLPLVIRNTSLVATQSFLDLPDSASVSGSYHIQVAASTNNVSQIRLFSTGGLLGATSNQGTATLTINASDLGPGLHPFYSLVDTSTGNHYRTATHWIRFVSP